MMPLLTSAVALVLAIPAAPPGRGSLLIVHPEPLRAAAQAWLDYRVSTGWQVRLHEVAGATADARRADVIEAIGSMAGDRGERSAVLLLGDAGDEGIPTWHVPQDDATLRAGGADEYATDHPYQVTRAGGHRPAVALGRVPARSPAECRALLEKVIAYERPDNLGPWRRRITYVAGEGGFGTADALLEMLVRSMIDDAVPARFDVSMTYAKASSIYCPPPSRLTDTVLERLGDGSLLFNYMGHGGPRRLDDLVWRGRRYPILELPDLARLEHAAAGRSPLALLVCCSAGWFDGPADRRSLGEALLFHPAGPVAVIAGSRPTHPYANAAFQNDVTALLLVEGVETVGELDLRATQRLPEIDDADRRLDALAAPIAEAMRWPSTLRALRRMHVELYNLLGDPALRLATPRRRVTAFRVAGSRATGRVEGMVEGRVVLTAETRRTAPARAGALVPVTADDRHLEAKAARNYPIANDPVLARVEADVAGGLFDATFVDGLPAGTAVVKAYAAGTDGGGRPIDAVGSTTPRPPGAPAGR